MGKSWGAKAGGHKKYHTFHPQISYVFQLTKSHGDIVSKFPSSEAWSRAEKGGGRLVWLGLGQDWGWGGREGMQNNPHRRFLL